MAYELPRIPLGQGIEFSIDFLSDHLAPLTKSISLILETAIDAMGTALMAVPPWALIIVIAILAWRLGSRRIGLLALFGLTLVWDLGLWEPTISTIILVLFSTVIATSIGVPLGILAAMRPGWGRIIMPLLDFMQTMPAFVYLIPAIPFFGLGPVSAIFSTVIFAMPPAIRLTCLGIRQVPESLTEAADAFGATRMQRLRKVELPLALPTIMAGINQTIMLSLSMVVIAAMIGARGLGGEVWKAIQRLEPGLGFEAGLAVVIVAVILDRVTQKLGSKNS
ncbi:binding-protein-dependent transport systems inner membrane component [Solidesulfovibrio fructosivorans JJ]]|uniref:Binding-protein-dependent transport systems inner membrane component n=1 Tax=Solidesulfovibrio fructosivorans JJ] TaxID=596151 RepID=E1JUP4_SOLFR|nr:proline/glycine betaine ABC transporter permease [Solidesulfovibrio fructosivorans]EFL51808.1 binding-protein-dependent transport systems inner membrane component [Solidesulfovibrio fructosivorans JJ]]